MSNVSPSVAESAAQTRISWKAPITYAIAALFLIWFAVAAHGTTRLRLNDRGQALNIADITINASGVLWVFAAITVIGAVWATYAATHRSHHRGARVGTGVVVGLLFVAGFLIFAGAGSTGAVTLTSVLVSTVAISTPLIFGALSGVVGEHAGVVNIAIEGDMLAGAFAAVMVASLTHSSLLGLVAAPIVACLFGWLLAVFSVKYGVDQIIVGVVLNVLALGLTTFFFGTVMKADPEHLNTNKYSLPDLPIPVLSQIPVIGPALFDQSILVYLMYVVVALLSVFLYRSRWGLRMRAVGEHPEAADTVGINVNRTRWRNTILGSAIAGLGGAFFTIGSGMTFSENISAGNGYIALAAMILGKWHPLGAVAAATMFGFAQAVARLLPALNGNIPSELVNMIPYVVTIVAVAGFVGRSKAPAAENIPYVK
ncbi:ABC transporter permease [Neoactinobaculum massilliense]|uniref:ABC transporter permease n=1 Tax=Neoactinobaculum massilliense TaxID=2364794 RepID=UPI000F54B14E|nr:ABC transporter permease [Neoactinobaculum massilliense]